MTVENLVEAFLAVMGLFSGFYALAMLLGQPGPATMQHESVSPERSHAIQPPAQKLAA